MKGTRISALRTTQCQEVAESLRVSEVNMPGTRLQVRAEMGAHPAERGWWHIGNNLGKKSQSQISFKETLQSWETKSVCADIKADM